MSRINFSELEKIENDNELNTKEISDRRRIKSLSNTSARFLRDITLTRRRRLGSNMIL